MTKKPKSGSPRRKVGPFWKNSPITLAISVLLLTCLAGASLWMWETGRAEKIAERSKWEFISVAAKLGFKVDEILVVGRSQTTREQLLKAVGIKRGAPILAFNLTMAKARVEKLPWVKTATVERLLPDTVLLRIEERKPLAIWQNDGRFSLIDFTGEVILRSGLEQFQDLMLVVGKGAPEHAADLLVALKERPELLTYVTSAVRVGERRWDLRMAGNINVRLPESDYATAWRRLAEYEKNHKVLERGVEVLDLRQPDRLIVRKQPRGALMKKNKGRET